MVMIYVASDHAGFYLKEEIINFLKEEGVDCVDIGPSCFDKEDDYPDYIIPAAKKVAENPSENKGIIIGNSGQGEAIAANKVAGIRTVLFYGGPEEIIVLSKIHNDANVLSLGAHFINSDEAKNAVKLWLQHKFFNENRHIRRINKINDFENNR